MTLPVPDLCPWIECNEPSHLDAIVRPALVPWFETGHGAYLTLTEATSSPEHIRSIRKAFPKKPLSFGIKLSGVEGWQYETPREGATFWARVAGIVRRLKLARPAGPVIVEPETWGKAYDIGERPMDWVTLGRGLRRAHDTGARIMWYGELRSTNKGEDGRRADFARHLCTAWPEASWTYMGYRTPTWVSPTEETRIDQFGLRGRLWPLMYFGEFGGHVSAPWTATAATLEKICELNALATYKGWLIYPGHARAAEVCHALADVVKVLQHRSGRE